ncbi:unnamed protein product [Caenorhabditis sp. 36 PRJEB53466]|nr:unnamed protein product [Caenorhabditis sp. 36 PRJEB53466]
MENKDKDYVLIGGGGFLGAHIIAALQENGVRNRIVVVDPHPRLKTFETVEIDEKNVIYEKGSFLDGDVLDRVLPNAVSVFHLCSIGHTGVYGAQKWHKLVHKVNVSGTEQLIRKCQTHKVSRFVYASSVAVVFTGKPLENVTEDEPLPDPCEYLDVYSRTKAEAEKKVLDASTPDFKTTALRFRAIYGPQDVSVAEKVVKMVKKNLFMFVISRHETEAISNMSSGENCGTAFFVADRELKRKNGKHGRAYFITDGEIIKQYEVWHPLIKALGKSPPVHRVPFSLVFLFVQLSSYVSYEMLNSAPPMSRFELEILCTNNTYSIERARRELNYHPKTELFQKTVSYYRNKSKFFPDILLFFDIIPTFDKHWCFVKCEIVNSLVMKLIIVLFLSNLTVSLLWCCTVICCDNALKKCFVEFIAALKLLIHIFVVVLHRIIQFQPIDTHEPSGLDLYVLVCIHFTMDIILSIYLAATAVPKRQKQKVTKKRNVRGREHPTVRTIEAFPMLPLNPCQPEPKAKSESEISPEDAETVDFLIRELDDYVEKLEADCENQTKISPFPIFSNI